MTEVLNCFSNAVIIGLATVMIWLKLYKKKLKSVDLLGIIGTLFLIQTLALGYFFIKSYVKGIYIFIILLISNYLIFRKKINETIITSFMAQFLVLISEILFVMFLMAFFKDNAERIMTNYFGSILSNSCIGILAVILSRFKIFSIIYDFFVRITKRLNKYYLICLIAILIISSNVLLELFYYKASSLTLLIVNSFIMILYSFVVFYSINDKNKTIQIQAEYDALLNNLNEYEKMLELQRINNHENKNQLVIIKSMCHTNNKKLRNYIDSIIEDNKEDDKNLQNLTKKIPAGGLRGLIYYKCLTMKDKNIYLQLEIEKDLDKKVNLLNSGKINQEICKIVGVFLDNAIEASEDTTEKIVSLELYMEYDKFVIAIGNTYFGNLNVEKIAQGGYTTKGDNHGYGLKLVNSIVENNRNLEKETNVIGRVFQQKLKIKLQNN